MAIKDIFNRGKEKIYTKRTYGDGLYRWLIAGRLKEFAVNKGLLSKDDWEARDTMSFRDLEIAWVYVIRETLSCMKFLPFSQEKEFYENIIENFRIILIDPVERPVFTDYQFHIDPMQRLYLISDGLRQRFVEERPWNHMLVVPWAHNDVLLLGGRKELPCVTSEFLLSCVDDKDMRRKYYDYTKEEFSEMRDDFIRSCNWILSGLSTEYSAKKLFEKFVSDTKKRRQAKEKFERGELKRHSKQR